MYFGKILIFFITAYNLYTLLNKTSKNLHVYINSFILYIHTSYREYMSANVFEDYMTSGMWLRVVW
jgi:hypothetical protein